MEDTRYKVQGIRYKAQGTGHKGQENVPRLNDASRAGMLNSQCSMFIGWRKIFNFQCSIFNGIHEIRIFLPWNIE